MVSKCQPVWAEANVNVANVCYHNVLWMHKPFVYVHSLTSLAIHCDCLLHIAGMFIANYEFLHFCVL